MTLTSTALSEGHFDDFLSKGDRDKKTPVRALCDDGAAI
jgi:hypothetical protein